MMEFIVINVQQLWPLKIDVVQDNILKDLHNNVKILELIGLYITFIQKI